MPGCRPEGRPCNWHACGEREFRELDGDGRRLGLVGLIGRRPRARPRPWKARPTGEGNVVDGGRFLAKEWVERGPPGCQGHWITRRPRASPTLEGADPTGNAIDGGQVPQRPPGWVNLGEWSGGSRGAGAKPKATRKAPTRSTVPRQDGTSMAAAPSLHCKVYSARWVFVWSQRRSRQISNTWPQTPANASLAGRNVSAS